MKRWAILVAVGVAVYAVYQAAAAEPVSRDIADVNRDGQVNVLDLLNVALCYGEVSEVPCLTSTPTPSATNTIMPITATASPTATSTSTPTSVLPPSATTSSTSTPTSPPLPTATPATYTVANLIADSTSSHEGCLSLDPNRGVAGYDWAFGAIQRSDPAVGSHFTPWYQITVDHCPNGVYLSNPPIPSGRVELRNFRGYALTDEWIPVGTGPDAGQWGNYTIGFRGSCFSGWNVRQETGGVSFGPGTDPVCIAHGWTWPRGLRPAGTQCILTLIEMRLVGTGSFLVNVGMDSYNGDSWVGDNGIGAFRRAGAWRTVGQSNCSAAILNEKGLP